MITTTEIRKFNRFTTLPFVIDLLKRKKLTLLNPNFWEDYNDRETMNVYRKKVGANSIYALCLTHKNETIHHWNAFANGASGCCIEFSPRKLIEILNKNNISHNKAEYIRIKDLPRLTVADDKIPYLKRHPFEPENEYRIIATSNDEQKPIFEIDIDLEAIRRITLSSKMPNNVFESNKQNLLEIAPVLKNKINHSTLFSNNNWIAHFNK
jgi:hypothetical protein